MTGSITDIVVPDSLVGTFHAEGKLRINVYRLDDTVRVEAMSLTDPVQTHFWLTPEESGSLGDLLKKAAEPKT